MCHHAHGVTEVDFGDMDAAIVADHQVDTQRTSVTRPDIFLQPVLHALAYGQQREGCFYLLVRPKDIFFVYTAACLEVAVAHESG